MKLLSLALIIFCASSAQVRQEPIDPAEFPGRDQLGVRLPNGKSQNEEILKEDYKKNLEDVAALAKLAEELKAEIEKNDRHIVSVASLKKTEDIEKLAKNIRARLKRY
jgi:uncharacterized protein YacL